MTASPAPAAMPSEEDRRSAAYLGLNPYAPETWPVETVNRLSRIHAEQGREAFIKEVASLMTPPIHSPHNACCYREQCKALEARALAAEAALAAMVKAVEPIDDALGEDDEGYGDGLTVVMKWGACTDYSVTLGDLRDIRKAIRAQGE